MKTLALFFALVLLSGCNSSEPKLGRISVRSPFITHFGNTTKVVSGGTNAGEDLCKSIVVDRFENIFCLGTTSGNFISASNGGFDVFIIKMNKHGSVVWAKQFGTDGDEYCWTAAVDRDGNLYCGGTAASIGTPFGQASFGGTDGIIMKVGPKGDLLWVTQYGTAVSEGCYNLALSSAGAVYCSGTATQPIEAGSGTTNNDPYVMKFSSETGAKLWERQLGPNTIAARGGNSVAGIDVCAAVVFDSAGNIMCWGNTSSSLEAAGVLNGANDMFYWALDPDGNTVAIKQYGTAYAWSTATESVKDVVVDSAGNFVIAATTTGNIHDVNPTSSTDVLMLKIDGSSRDLLWINQIGANEVGAGNNDKTELMSYLKLDSAGNIYTAGYTFGHTADTNADITKEDVLVMKLSNSTGELEGILQLGQNAAALTGGNYSGQDLAECLDVDTDGNVYIGGATYGNFKENNTSGDVIVLRLSPGLEATDLVH